MVRLCMRVLFSYLHISTFFVSFRKKYDFSIITPTIFEWTPRA